MLRGMALEPASSGVDSTRSQVGVAKRELRLTQAASLGATELLSPGRGRRLIALSEVDIGTGRPDLILLASSNKTLLHRREEGFRLRNYTEARVLATLLKVPDAVSVTNGSIGISDGHFRQITGSLRDRGWLSPRGREEGLKAPISQSLLIEAKVNDWRGGLLQLMRNCRTVNSTALLVPSEVDPRIPRTLLQRHGFGVVLVDATGRLKWKRRPRRREAQFAATLWLTELAVRHVEVSRPR